MKRVLVASDLTARSDRAVQRALSIAAAFGAELNLVHVIDETLSAPLALKHQEAAREALAAQILAAGVGTVAEGLLAETPCDVLAVKAPLVSTQDKNGP